MGHKCKRSKTASGQRQRRYFQQNHRLPKPKEINTYQRTRDIQNTKQKRTPILQNRQNSKYIGQRKN